MFDKNEALACVGDTGDRNGSTVGKIYTPIFWFFRKKFVNIVSSELRPVSNERSGDFTLYRGIHNFLNPSMFMKNNSFLNFML